MTTTSEDVDECKFAVSSQSPLIGRPCSVCRRGPCQLLQARPGGGGGGHNSRPQIPRTFPGFKQQAVDEVIHRDGVILEFGQEPFSFSQSFTLSTQIEGITEFSRLPSKGMQVKHLRVFDNRNASGYYQLKRDSTYEGRCNCASMAPLFVERIFSELYGGGYMDSLDQVCQSMVTDARDLAYQTMVPSLSTGFSVLNFLYELKDFKRWFEFFKSTWPNMVRIALNIKRRPLAELSSLAAEGLLELEFGVLPLFSDIQKIVNVLSTFKAKTELFLLKAHEQESRRHYRRALASTEELKELLTFDLSFADFGGLPCPIKAVPKLEPQTHVRGASPSDSMVYCATMDFNYTVEKIVEINSVVLGLLQQLGVTPDASIIWNAMPYSFVADWFVRVGDSLHRYASLDVISAEVVIRDWIESHRLRLTWDILSSSDSSGYPTWNWPDQISMIGATLYSRRPGIPDTDRVLPATVTDDGFTPMHGALSASLLRKGIPKLL
jgi:hypothetical protein